MWDCVYVLGRREVGRGSRWAHRRNEINNVSGRTAALIFVYSASMREHSEAAMQQMQHTVSPTTIRACDSRTARISSCVCTDRYVFSLLRTAASDGRSLRLRASSPAPHSLDSTHPGPSMPTCGLLSRCCWRMVADEQAKRRARGVVFALSTNYCCHAESLPLGTHMEPTEQTPLPQPEPVGLQVGSTLYSTT